MDDDIYVFELFQEVIRSLEEDTSSGLMHLLSKEPLYADDDPAKLMKNRKERA